MPRKRSPRQSTVVLKRKVPAAQAPAVIQRAKAMGWDARSGRKKRRPTPRLSW